MREAREAAGLSREAVADRLHLHPMTLAALEEDRFDVLPEPPYVRGYLRGCAKVLEMDPEALLEAFRACGQPAGPEEAHPPGPVRGRIEPPRGLRGFRPGPLWVIVLGAILALAVAGAWSLLTGGGADEGAPASDGMTGDQGREEAPAIADDGPGSGVSSPAAAPLPEALRVQASGAGGDPAATPGDTGDTGAGQVPGSEGPGSGGNTRRDEAVENVTDPEDAARATAPGHGDREGEVPPGPGRLRLVFREDCWVQITDADGEDLLSGLIRAGREHRLEGEAPIRVFLGNAPGVELTFNGRRVDTAARARDDRTARFTLSTS
nr:RodZ domain-containing protein [Ectothiorhodospira mobilis]